MTVTAVNRARAVERLDRAGGAVRGALDALCAQLRADATAAAVAGSAGPAGVAVELRDAADRPVRPAAGLPAQPWAVCGRASAPAAYAALAARADLPAGRARRRGRPGRGRGPVGAGTGTHRRRGRPARRHVQPDDARDAVLRGRVDGQPGPAARPARTARGHVVQYPRPAADP